MQPAPSCRDHEILKGRYRADLRVYIAAAAMLENFERRDFAQTYEDAGRARLAWERARATLNAHVAEHGCQP
jgi:hypothetical protein